MVHVIDNERVPINSRDIQMQQPPSPTNSENDPLLDHDNHGDVNRRLLRRKSWSSNQYLLGVVGRLLTLITILSLLIGFTIRLRYADTPSEYDDSKLTFDFTVNSSSFRDLQLWDEDFDYNLKVEMHSHSTASDGSMTPTQLVSWASAYGFDAIALTDHNTISGHKEAIEAGRRVNITVIPGMEYSCCRIHMNLLNVTNITSLVPNSPWPSDKELQRVIYETHERGGYVVVNHLPWSLNTEYGYQLPTLRDHPSVHELLDWGVDAIESVHEGQIDLQTLRLMRQKGMPVVAANDIHNPSQPPYSYTIFRSVSNSADDILRAIFDKLKKQSSSILLAPTGPRERAYPVRKAGFVFDAYVPLTSFDFGWLYSERRGMYSFMGTFCHPRQFEFHTARAVFFVIWIALAFITFEGVRLLLIAAGTSLWRYTLERRDFYAN